jgi:hypothetical protein
MSKAGVRAVLVASLVAVPSLLLPGYTSEAPEMIVLLSIMAGAITFSEYNAEFPSFMEFRYAPPVNRLRFIGLAAMFLMLTLVTKDMYDPTFLTGVLADFGFTLGILMDFPYSPVRLVIQMLPVDADAHMIESVRTAAGITYVLGLATIVTFLGFTRLGWPVRNGNFNVWVNLPLFDPTMGGDVVARLQRDGRGNVIVGFLLPFIIPAVVKLATNLISPISLEDPQTLIWTASAWAFLPASMIMRGMAMLRIAELIEAKRNEQHALGSAQELQAA